MDTPRLLPQPPLFLEGLRPDTTLPFWQEGAGGCVMALYSCIIVRLPMLLILIIVIIEALDTHT